jgi:hypothetical protein
MDAHTTHDSRKHRHTTHHVTTHQTTVSVPHLMHRQSDSDERIQPISAATPEVEYV